MHPPIPPHSLFFTDELFGDTRFHCGDVRKVFGKEIANKPLRVMISGVAAVEYYVLAMRSKSDDERTKYFNLSKEWLKYGGG